MLRALFLALIVALLPAPSMAQGMPCHGEQQTIDSASTDHRDHHPGKAHHEDREGQLATGAHSCIGCVPPTYGIAALAPPSLPEAMPPSPRLMQAMVSALPRPETPPPRMSA